MRGARLFVSLSLSPFALLAVVATGCGSAASPPSAVLSGNYIAVTSGPIASIDFIDSSDYSFVETTCPGGGKTCSSSGTYAFSSDYSSLVFTDGTSGGTTTLAFSPLTTAVASANGSGMTGVLISGFTLGMQSFSDLYGSETDGGTSKPAGTSTGTGSGSGSAAPSSTGSGTGTATGTGMGSSGPVNVPLSIVTGSGGAPTVTVEVSVGGGVPFTAVVDTGSVGLAVAPGVVPDDAWSVSTTKASITYGQSLVVSGVLADASVTIGTVSTPSPIPVVKVTGAACASGVGSCADTGSPFRFANGASAVLGIGMASTSALESPLIAASKNKQYALRLSATGTTGTLEIDPTSYELANTETQVTLPAVSGSSGWDDTQVPFCLNSFCGNGLLDTGAGAGGATMRGLESSDYDSMGVTEGATSVPYMTQVSFDINMGVSWQFTVARTPKPGVDLINLTSAAGPNDLGLAPFRQFDVLYDYGQGTIALTPK
jgi:hypothetical protein